MRENALDADAKPNGLAVLQGLVATGKVYDGAYKNAAVKKRRAKAKAAKKTRSNNR